MKNHYKCANDMYTFHVFQNVLKWYLIKSLYPRIKDFLLIFLQVQRVVHFDLLSLMKEIAIKWLLVLAGTVS